MTALIIIAALAAIIVLLCLIPINLLISAGNNSFSLGLRIGKKQIFPTKKKAKKKAKAIAEPKSVPKKKARVSLIRRLGLSRDEWIEVIKTLLKALGRIGSAVNMPLLRLHILISDPDPYKTVMNYNYALTAAYSVLPYAEKALNIKDRDIAINTDFNSEKTIFELSTRLYIRIGKLLCAIIAAVISVISIIIKHRIATAKERKARHGEQTQRSYAVNNEQHQEHGGGK